MEMEYVTNALTSDAALAAVIAILAAFIGTYFGATTAQNIALKSKKKEDLLKDIKHLNAAITVAYCVCNNFLNLKAQHIQGIKANYDTLRQEWLAHLDGLANGVETPFRRSIELGSLAELNIPNEALQQFALEKITLSSRPLAAVLFTINSGIELNQVIKVRNEYLEQRKRNPPTGRAAFDTYLGTSIDGTNVDETYRNLTDSLSSKVDEGIFFSHLLCKDLAAMCVPLMDAYAKEFKQTLTASKTDFTATAAAGLIPKDEEFKDWLKGFETTN
jgi:hypothetical protein